MSIYLYNPDSPPSGVSLNQNGAIREILLWPGKEVDLPGDNEFTRVLLAEGHLIPVPVKPEPVPVPAKTEPAEPVPVTTEPVVPVKAADKPKRGVSNE